MAEAVHVVCPACGGINRLPTDKLGAGGKCGKCKQPLFQGQPVSLTAQSFARHITKSDIPVLVDFWAEWCAPCKMVAPTVEKIAEDYAGRIKVGKVDVDNNPQIAGNYGIRSIPTLIIFKGGQPVDQLIGAQPEPAITSRIDQVLS